MNITLKQDPVWLGSLPSPPVSPTLLLLGGDGQQVAVPAHLLLAVSPLVRSILIDLLPPAYGPCFLSLPDVTGKVLHVVADILDTGEVVGEHEDEIEEVRQVFGILGVEALLVSYHLDSIQVDQVLDRGIKVENVTEVTDFISNEENMFEVFVKAENKEEKELIYSGKVKIEDFEIEIEEFHDGFDLLQVSVAEQVEESELCQQLKSKNVTHSEIGSFSHRSFLSNKSFNNNSEDVSNKLKDVLNNSEVVPSNLVSVPENINLVNGGKSKPRPFHARSIIGSTAGSDRDKITITKKFSNPYFTGNEFSSTESELEKDEPPLDKIMETHKIRSFRDQLKFPCNLCSLKFKFKYSLKRHIKSIHEQIRIPCHLCPSKFTNKHCLVIHIKSAHEKIQFLCDLCPSKFTSQSGCVAHMKSIHEQIKYSCDLCQLKFTMRGSLRRHINTTHDTSRKSCSLCPSKFTCQCGRGEHVASVREKIEVLCNLCPLKFTKKSNLIRHIKSVHNLIRIPCSQCPLKFASKRSLVKHLSNMHQKRGYPGIE